MKALLLNITFIALLLSLTAAAQKITSKESLALDEISKYLQQQIDTSKQNPIAGIAVSIIKGNKIIYLKAFGVSDIQTHKSLSPKDNFHVASISKTFTAATIMQLSESKKLCLDSPLNKYLPYFKMADNRFEKITLRQILNHTSGLPDVEDYQWEKHISDEGALERNTRSIDTCLLISEPGKEYHYSNTGYDILGDLIAKMIGEPFERYVKQHLLANLKMYNSSFLLSDIPLGKRTSPHTGMPLEVSKVYPYNRMHAPSSTLNSNVADLSNWIIANLNNGFYKGNRVLSASEIKLMQSPTFTIDSSLRREICLSWFIYPYKEYSVINHDGADDGYVSVLCLIPTLNCGFVILFNSDEVNSYSIKNYVLDLIIKTYGNSQ